MLTKHFRSELFDDSVHRHVVYLSWSKSQSRGPGGSMSQVVGSNNSYKPITNTAWVRARLCKLQKGCSRLTAACDKVDQLLAHGRWFSPGTAVSSTTKTGHHDIAEILLKVALKHQKSINQSTKFQSTYSPGAQSVLCS